MSVISILISNYNFYYKRNKKIFFLSFFWILCFIPINVNPENFKDLSTTIQIRLILPFLTVFIYSLYLFKKKNIRVNFFLTIPFFAYINLGILLTLANNKLNTYENIYWGISMLIPYFYIYALNNKLNFLKSFLIFSIILISLIFFFYIFKIFYAMINVGKIMNLYSIWDLIHDSIIPPPRPSGFARMAIIIAISSSFVLLFAKKIYFSKVILIIIIFSSTFGILFQSRTMTFIYFFLNICIAIILLIKKKKIKKFLLIFILPILISFLYNYTVVKFNLAGKDSNVLIDLQNTSRATFLRQSDPETFSSNRFENWSRVIKISTDNNFRGFGFQSDRIFINQSVHNIYLYSLICGGLISMILMVIISIRACWVTFYILYNYTILNKKYDVIDLISIFVSIILLLRGFLETSYGVYSIDYLLFIITFFINETNYKKLFINNSYSRFNNYKN